MFAQLVEGRLVVSRDVAKGGIILVEKPVILQVLFSAPSPFLRACEAAAHFQPPSPVGRHSEPFTRWGRMHATVRSGLLVSRCG
jgi:hypothetical protein